MTGVETMQPALEETLRNAPNCLAITRAVLAEWPKHQPFVERHFAACDAHHLAFLDGLAKRILALVGDDLPLFAAGYKAMCAMFLKYEIQTRRTKALEHGDFDTIRRKYYDNEELMSQYMRGLMLSQILWRQHAGASAFFAERFLPALKDGYDYLEIGPGHGLWLSFAATDPRCRSLTGWDVAPASLEMTRQGLAKMGIRRDIDLELHDVCASEPAVPRFDAIVISQVLELVSSPSGAIDHLAGSLRPGGILFVNCPTKMLAPDHIRVWSGFEEIDGLLTASGLVKLESDRITPAADKAPDEAGYSYVAFARKP